MVNELFIKLMRTQPSFKRTAISYKQKQNQKGNGNTKVADPLRSSYLATIHLRVNQTTISIKKKSYPINFFSCSLTLYSHKDRSMIKMSLLSSIMELTLNCEQQVCEAFKESKYHPGVWCYLAK